jgi:hypothetical protein
MQILDVISLAVLAFVGFRLTDAARHAYRDRSRVRGLLAGLRLRHFALAVPVLFVVVVTFVMLAEIPGLSWGWWSAIGGTGNPAFGGAPEGSTGPFEVVIPIVFAGLLLVGLPLLVEGEEWVFRRGAEHRGRAANLRRAVLFGLVHALIGVPIAAALALTVGGVYFTWAYLRAYRATGSAEAALNESTRSHLAYNLDVLGIVVVGVLIS